MSLLFKKPSFGSFHPFADHKTDSFHSNNDRKHSKPIKHLLNRKISSNIVMIESTSYNSSRPNTKSPAPSPLFQSSDVSASNPPPPLQLSESSSSNCSTSSFLSFDSPVTTSSPSIILTPTTSASSPSVVSSNRPTPYSVPIPAAFSPLVSNNPSDYTDKRPSVFSRSVPSSSSSRSLSSFFSSTKSSSSSNPPSKKHTISSLSMFSAVIKKHRLEEREKKSPNSVPVTLARLDSPPCPKHAPQSTPSSPILKSSRSLKNLSLHLFSTSAESHAAPSKVNRPKSLQLQPFQPSESKFRQYQQQSRQQSPVANLPIDLDSVSVKSKSKHKFHLPKLITTHNHSNSTSFSAARTPTKMVTMSTQHADRLEVQRMQRLEAFENERCNRLQRTYLEHQDTRQKMQQLRKGPVEYRLQIQQQRQQQRADLEAKQFQQQLRSQMAIQNNRIPLLPQETHCLIQCNNQGVAGSRAYNNQHNNTPSSIKAKQAMASYKRKSRGYEMSLMMKYEFESIIEEDDDLINDNTSNNTDQAFDKEKTRDRKSNQKKQEFDGLIISKAIARHRRDDKDTDDNSSSGSASPSSSSASSRSCSSSSTCSKVSASSSSSTQETTDKKPHSKEAKNKPGKRGHGHSSSVDSSQSLDSTKSADSFQSDPSIFSVSSSSRSSEETVRSDDDSKSHTQEQNKKSRPKGQDKLGVHEKFFKLLQSNSLDNIKSQRLEKNDSNATLVEEDTKCISFPLNNILEQDSFSDHDSFSPVYYSPLVGKIVGSQHYATAPRARIRSSPSLISFNTLTSKRDLFYSAPSASEPCLANLVSLTGNNSSDASKKNDRKHLRSSSCSTVSLATICEE